MELITFYFRYAHSSLTEVVFLNAVQIFPTPKVTIISNYGKETNLSNRHDNISGTDINILKSNTSFSTSATNRYLCL